VSELLIVTGEKFLWVQNEPHLRLLPYESEVTEYEIYTMQHLLTWECGSGDHQVNADFWKGIASYPFGGEISFQESP
jgi:hypothetical protein